MPSSRPPDTLRGYLATHKRLWLVPLLLLLLVVVLLSLAFLGPESLLDAIYGEF